MRADYNYMSDEELIATLREGDTRVTDFLMDKYKELVRMKAKTMFILGADNDDLIQEGMIGLFKAVRDYDPGRDASFRTFAELCISRQMYTAIEASGRKKHSPLNSYVSIYTERSKEDGTEPYLLDVLGKVTELSPEELFIGEENVKRLEEEIAAALSPFEMQVLNLRLTGMGYVEIAHILGKDEKAADNALSRIKVKVKKILS